jgi:hypothetical protein
MDQWGKHGVFVISNGQRNVRNQPLKNVHCVLDISAVFLATHDYSMIDKTKPNIVNHLLKIIIEVAPFIMIQIITNNAPDCKAIGTITAQGHHHIF